MKNEIIEKEDIEFHKSHGGMAYIFGKKLGIIRDTYFDITHDMDTGDIIEENIFKRCFNLHCNNPKDRGYLEKREFLKNLN